MSALRIFHRRCANVDLIAAAGLDHYRERARKDAITIAAQGRAIRDLRDQVAELRAQLAVSVDVGVDRAKGGTA